MKLDLKTAYILGLWNSDRCSSAKGIVGIRNRNSTLLNEMKSFLQSLNQNSKERTVQGFSSTREVYCCNSKLRRFFEAINEDKLGKLNKQKLVYSYIAGLIDGDGTVSCKKSTLRIYYNRTELEHALSDLKLLKRLGYKTTLVTAENLVTLNLLKPRKIARHLLFFVKAKNKKSELEKMAI